MIEWIAGIQLFCRYNIHVHVGPTMAESNSFPKIELNSSN